jgi:Berberine and berberine like
VLIEVLAAFPDRAAHSYGGNAKRLIDAKCRYDPDNIFSSAIPLPPPA